MRTIERMRFVLLMAAAAACSGPAEPSRDAGELVDDGGRESDAGREDDAGMVVDVDAGSDAGRELDAGSVVDGGSDAGTDAGPALACDLYASVCAENGCLRGQSCRRTQTPGEMDNTYEGPPACMPTGSIAEHNYGFTGSCSWTDPDRFCRCGLFCQTWGHCLRYCDPGGEPCPNTATGGAQYCRTDGPGGVPYCSP